MRNVFILNEEIISSLTALADRVSKAENWYDPEINQVVPGDEDKYHTYIGTHKVVLTWTMKGGKVFRHMSMSAHGEDKYPLPEAVFTAAHHLGFKGVEPIDIEGMPKNSRKLYKPIPGRLALMHNDDEKCIVVVEEIDDAEKNSRAHRSPQGQEGTGHLN